MTFLSYINNQEKTEQTTMLNNAVTMTMIYKY